ncbi:zinc finger protein 93-like [Colias croceus]|uniref:zinc finger protein 93-like n=1 Tax=Colias crocea TaxID=72248 RepID=UPI001E27F90D|nr:zinc finger protein 93-like [Colias croceus]
MDLDLVKHENVELLGRCKCCLDDVNLKSLWEEYDNDGQVEVYGAMVEECYSLNWERKDGNEFICSACIVRLRDALNFKREIIASDQVLQQVQFEFKNNISVDVKVEVESSEDIDEYHDVEYLELEGDNSATTEANATEIATELPSRKWPKKRKGADRLKVYKKYTQLELREAMDAVKSGKMTRTEASEIYNIPRNTIANNLNKYNSLIETHNDSTEETSNKEKNFKLIEEIKALLTLTNAIPFKTKTAKYYCAYCSTDGPMFEDGDELRIHTINEHSEHRTYNVDHFMRPYWLNEILKLDVDNLACNLCETKLPDWNGMFQHFSNEHEIEFDEAYTRVVPYIISDNIRCVLCHEAFNNFHQLDGHMNAHYNNYICYECGDTFVASSRLEKHVQVHSKGKFPCDECGKVFSLQKYRVKHTNLVHRQNVLKCQFCPEKFSTAVLRQLHHVEKHKDQIKEYTCEFCGTVFNYKPKFIKHLQRKHSIEKNNKCDVCDKSFIKKYELRLHMLRHKQNKKYVCTVCGEGYRRKANFNNHFKIHQKENVEITLNEDQEQITFKEEEQIE